MSNKKFSIFFIRHMIEFIEKIQNYTRLMPYEEFCEDEATILIIERLFINLGEAATRVPYTFRETHNYIEWDSITGMRNTLVHGYDGLDHRIIWDTIQNDLADLLKQLTSLDFPEGE